jgi:hypothetical protein
MSGGRTERLLDPRDADLCRKKYPRLGELIAKGILADEHGKLKQTPSDGNTHATWWPFEGVAREKPFKVVEEQ